MHKTRKIIGYSLSFILTILLVIFIVLTILKTTILNENYVLKTFDNNNYYKLVSDKILENMEDYMRSSGLDKEILTDIFTEKDIKNDVKKYLDKIYKDSNIKFDDSKLKEKLVNNINESLAKHNLQITDQEAIDSFVSEMVKIYRNEVNIYSLVDNHVNLFHKFNSILNIAFIALLMVCILLSLSIILMKAHCIASSFFASGLILLFLRFVIYEKIDFKNLLVISDEISMIIKHLLTKIANDMALCSYIFIGLGIILTIVESIMHAKRRSHHKKMKSE